MKRHYFDYAASTPVDPAVVKVMAPFWGEKFGNPGSLHSFGQEASAAVFEARDTIAKSLGCHYSEIVFTGSATEANNLALRGASMAARLFSMRTGVVSLPQRTAPTALSEKSPLATPSFSELRSFSTKTNERLKIIVSAIEHDSVLDTARELEKEGVEVVYLPVSKNGIVDLKKLEAALDDRTILVSIMYANNEIGVIQPIKEIVQVISKWKLENRKNKLPITNYQLQNYPLFHTDAVQAFNYLNCNVNDLGVDMLTLSSQKIYGPKGIGLLYIKSPKSLVGQAKVQGQKSGSDLIYPIITGGGQERGFRSGTENVTGIVGFAKAVELADKLREKESKRLSALREYFLKQVKKINPKIELNGDAENRLPNNINLYIPAKGRNKGSAQDLVIALDMAGFAVSPGSACSARVCSPSHVLKALGYSDEKAMSGLRITFGRQTDKKSVDALLRALDKLIQRV